MQNNMTAYNLRSAHGGESMAYMRYRIWGDKARQDGYPNVGRLFDAIAYSERIHASNHFRQLKDVVGDFAVSAMAAFGLGDSDQNLEGAIAGENFEVEEMYPAFMAVAERQEEERALRSMRWAWESEKTHTKLFSAALESVRKGHDVDISEVQICSVCGFTVLGEAPQVCPICGAKQDQFVEF